MKSSIGRLLTQLCGNDYCICCLQSSQSLLCDFCHSALPLFDLQQCHYNLLNIPKISNGLNARQFHNLLSSGEYKWPLSWLVSGLKFSAKQQHAKALAEIFCRHTVPPDGLPQLIIPVPLHSRRLADRLYNQAHLIANDIGKKLGIAVRSDAVCRQVYSQPQSQLNAQQRKTNTQGAFALRQQIEEQHVAIFDDVITTGATVNALYQLLQSHYPHMQIDVWSMCTTLEH